MPDFDMCKVTDCGLARSCMRHADSGTEPSETHQAYLVLKREWRNATCPFYSAVATKVSEPAAVEATAIVDLAPEPVVVVPTSASLVEQVRSQISQVSYHEYDSKTVCLITMEDGFVAAGADAASQEKAYAQAFSHLMLYPVDKV